MPQLKNLMQMERLNIRRAYKHSGEPLPRIASFIGTSNRRDLLTDCSGSRRFICVEVEHPHRLHHTYWIRPALCAAETRAGTVNTQLVQQAGRSWNPIGQCRLLPHHSCRRTIGGNVSIRWTWWRRCPPVVGRSNLYEPEEQASGSFAGLHPVGLQQAAGTDRETCAYQVWQRILGKILISLFYMNAILVDRENNRLKS